MFQRLLTILGSSSSILLQEMLGKEKKEISLIYQFSINKISISHMTRPMAIDIEEETPLFQTKLLPGD